MVNVEIGIVGSYALNALSKPHALNARNKSKIRVTNIYRFYFLEDF